MTGTMTVEPEPSRPTPYLTAVGTYRAAGWTGVLPLPFRRKADPPAGFTGNRGAWPSTADYQAWTDNTRPSEGGGNIALRMPPDIIGVDVDNYGDKGGALTLADAVTTWGPLPDTWTSTSRDDGISGIRLYRVPEGMRWPGVLGPGIEIIQTVHRYAVVWPSVHPEGRVYRWCRPDGVASLAPPQSDDLPDLPPRWVAGMSGGQRAEEVAFAELTSKGMVDWITGHSFGDPCRVMRRAADKLADDLATGSAHESLKHLMSLARAAEKGHTGLSAALTEAGAAFLAEATSTARGGATRDRDEAIAEWQRSLAGAISRVLGAPTVPLDDPVPDDPCADPWGGILIPTAPTAPAATPAVKAEPLAIESSNTAAAAGEAAVEPEVERTSWWPIDLGPVLAGENTEPEPAVLARADGHALFYKGKVNGLIGESESGKSWLLLAAVAEELTAGHAVLYLDFEDTAGSIVARLLALGVDRATLAPDARLFAYVNPDDPMSYQARAEVVDVLDRGGYDLIGLDGVNAAMGLFGLAINSNDDATKFSHTLLRMLVKTGATVVTVDHVGKDKENRGKGAVGAQAKRAMIGGSLIGVEVLAPFGRGQTGKLRLTVDKDRPGHVRGFAENSKNVGIAVLESGSNGSVRVRIEPPGSAAAAVQVREPWRPTVVMEKVSRMLSTVDGMLSQTAIEKTVGGQQATVRRAVDVLVEEGYVSRHAGPRNSLLHRYERTFRDLDGLVTPTFTEPASGDDRHDGW